MIHFLPYKSLEFGRIRPMKTFQRIVMVLGTAILTVFLSVGVVDAKSGCCSGHDGVSCGAGPQGNGRVICNDGWTGSSCLYSEMVMCGGSSTTTSTYSPAPVVNTPAPTPIPTIIPTPKPTPPPTHTPTPTPTPTPSTSPSPELTTTPTPSPDSEESEVLGESDTMETTTSEAVGGLSALGFTGWLGYKGLKKVLSKLLN